MKSSGNKLKSRLELSKLKIMIPVSFTGLTGYFLYNPEISVRLLLVTLGILFMAIAASVMNQLQEADLDAKMNRTAGRPLPAGKIKPVDARIFFFLMLVAGTVLITLAGNLTASLIGLFTVLWYNGIYTNAKRFTRYAIIPGAITGALPPLIGWVAAGGGIFDRTILLIGLLFFTGQIPHFMLLLLKYGDEYENAGIPTISGLIGSALMKRITFGLVTATAAAALLLSYFELSEQFLLYISIFVSIALLIQFSGLLKEPADKKNFRRYFHSLDAYILFVMILLISDRIF